MGERGVINKHCIFQGKINVLLVLLITGILCGTSVYGENITDLPDVKVIDVSATLDVSQLGEIPLGQIPDERITVAISIVNAGTNPVSGIRIKTFLVREGREDTISTQLGSDFRNAELNSGEVKVIKNNYMVSKTLKPGKYKILIRIDMEVTNEESNPPSLEYIGSQILSIGSYADAKGAIPVYSPNDINTPGTYQLMRDISGTNRNNVMKITNSDITIDGGGHTIKGVSNGFSSGIYVDGGSTIKNIHIRNCIFEGMDFGVWFYRVESGTIINCTFINCKNVGIRMDQSRLNTIADNTLTDNVLGIGLFQSAGNVITNNYLKNQFNAAANDDQRNSWSIEPISGTNIVGGHTKGGNAWVDLKNGGFSQTTPDMNNDGIIDTPYSINGNNIDYYPLAISPVTEDSAIVPPEPESEVQISTQPEQTDIPDVAVDANGEEVRINDGTELSNETTIESASPNPTPGTGSADLAILNITVPDEACLAVELPIRVSIENQGDQEASFFSIHYYLSEDLGISASDVDVGSYLVERLLPGEQLEIQDQGIIPAGLGVRPYSFGVIVDPANDIYEQNKQNNIMPLIHRIVVKSC